MTAWGCGFQLGLLLLLLLLLLMLLLQSELVHRPSWERRTGHGLLDLALDLALEVAQLRDQLILQSGWAGR